MLPRFQLGQSHCATVSPFWWGMLREAWDISPSNEPAGQRLDGHTCCCWKLPVLAMDTKLGSAGVGDRTADKGEGIGRIGESVPNEVASSHAVASEVHGYEDEVLEGEGRFGLKVQAHKNAQT